MKYFLKLKICQFFAKIGLQRARKYCIIRLYKKYTKILKMVHFLVTNKNV